MGWGISTYFIYGIIKTTHYIHLGSRSFHHAVVSSNVVLLYLLNVCASLIFLNCSETDKRLLTIVNGTTQCHLVYSPCCTPPPLLTLNILHSSQNETFTVLLCSFQPLEPPRVFFVSLDLSILENYIANESNNMWPSKSGFFHSA